MEIVYCSKIEYCTLYPKLCGRGMFGWTLLAPSCSAGVRVWFRPWRRAMRWTWSTSQRGSSLSVSPPPWRNAATPPTSRRWRRCCGPNMESSIWWATAPKITLMLKCIWSELMLSYSFVHFMISGAQPERAEEWLIKVKPQGTNISASSHQSINVF